MTPNQHNDHVQDPLPILSPSCSQPCARHPDLAVLRTLRGHHKERHPLQEQGTSQQQVLFRPSDQQPQSQEVQGHNQGRHPMLQSHPNRRLLHPALQYAQTRQTLSTNFGDSISVLKMFPNVSTMKHFCIQHCITIQGLTRKTTQNIHKFSIIIQNPLF